jgi:SAM-dependent methyltransferase
MDIRPSTMVMTKISLQLLAYFLNTFKPEGRIADYGGTSKHSNNIVKDMFRRKDVQIVDGALRKDNKISLVILGDIKKEHPEYIPLDLDNGVDLLKPIKGLKFDAGICMDLLEHTENPFIIAKNISNSLKKDAFLFVTVPFVWGLHYFPKDYWRFCPQGLEQLFSDMEVQVIDTVRDPVNNEELPSSRLAAVFKKK